MRLQGIIFDVDGTLIDSNDLHAKAWVEAFEHFGTKLDFDTVRSQIGKGGDLLVPDLLGAREMQQFGHLIEDYRKDLFRRKYRGRIKPFPGIRDTFRELKGSGVRIVLATSSNEEDFSFFLDLLGVEDLIDESTSADDVELSKPAPDVFEAALGKLGTHVSRTFVVGDTPYDILAAHRNALPIAAVRCGGFPEETLRKAELVCDDVPQLMQEIEAIERILATLESDA
jgi:HAD superfamily hydrolase (TIGR01509 family)